MIYFEDLEWDSNFFGFKVGRIISKVDSGELCSLLRESRNKDYRLIYSITKHKLNKTDFGDNIKGYLVDKKVTYSKKVNKIDFKNNCISRYHLKIADKRLINLAIQSGEYSRYRIDNKISNQKFEELYKLWIINSINRKIAKEVFVFNEKKLSGVITLGEKNKRADIGLIAVDKECRGQGIGNKLLKTAENWAFGRGYQEIQVVTQRDNILACNFYEKNYYREDKVEFIYHFWLNN